jgi:hypothetical protein
VAFGDADRTALLADFGVDVTYSATTVKGLLDEAPWDGLQTPYTNVSGVTRTVLVATGAISPAQSGSITVDGTAYTVVDTNPEPPDGRFTRILLKG